MSVFLVTRNAGCKCLTSVVLLFLERSFGERNIIDTSRIAVITMMNVLDQIHQYCKCLILMFVWYNKYANNFAEYIRSKVTSQVLSITKMIFRHYWKYFCLKVLKLVFSLSCACTAVSKISQIRLSSPCVVRSMNDGWSVVKREYYHNCNI